MSDKLFSSLPAEWNAGVLQERVNEAHSNKGCSYVTVHMVFLPSTLEVHLYNQKLNHSLSSKQKCGKSSQFHWGSLM